MSNTPPTVHSTVQPLAQSADLCAACRLGGSTGSRSRCPPRHPRRPAGSSTQGSRQAAGQASSSAAGIITANPHPPIHPSIRLPTGRRRTPLDMGERGPRAASALLAALLAAASIGHGMAQSPSPVTTLFSFPFESSATSQGFWLNMPASGATSTYAQPGRTGLGLTITVTQPPATPDNNFVNFQARRPSPTDAAAAAFADGPHQGPSGWVWVHSSTRNTPSPCAWGWGTPRCWRWRCRERLVQSLRHGQMQPNPISALAKKKLCVLAQNAKLGV